MNIRGCLDPVKEAAQVFGLHLLLVLSGSLEGKLNWVSWMDQSRYNLRGADDASCPAYCGHMKYANVSDSLNRYILVNAAAKRTRQLYAGAPTLGVSKSMKPCRIAQDEVRAGRVLAASSSS